MLPSVVATVAANQNKQTENYKGKRSEKFGWESNGGS